MISLYIKVHPSILIVLMFNLNGINVCIRTDVIIFIIENRNTSKYNNKSVFIKIYL